MPTCIIYEPLLASIGKPYLGQSTLIDGVNPQWMRNFQVLNMESR